MSAAGSRLSAFAEAGDLLNTTCFGSRDPHRSRPCRGGFGHIRGVDPVLRELAD